MESIDYQIPTDKEYAPFYGRYVKRVPDGDIVRQLRLAAFDTIAMLETLPPEKWDYRYEEGKWSVKELVLHLIDTERVMAYRALRIARGDQTPLPGFEQDAFNAESDADSRSPHSLIAEYKAVREASIHLFKNLAPKRWSHSGTASGFPVSVRGLAFIIAGHEMHHIEILRNRYL